MPDFIAVEEVRESSASLRRLRENISLHLRGKNEVVDRVLICLLAGGHVLLEDLPGVGKTTLAYCLARSLDCAFSRIQFTSDLLPSDVLGVSVYDESVREFVFKPGPIFGNFILADEINRTTPKTQSSLLEVMDRGKVSVDGQTHSVGSPFMVFATQNPTDYEGTFPLPESQLDRFLMRLQMGYPAPADELRILREGQTSYDMIQLSPVVSRAAVLKMQQLARKVYIEDSILEYVMRIVSATRTESEFKFGISVRGALALRTAAQARALLQERDFVIPEDVSELVVSVFGHRLALRRSVADPMEERQTITGILRKIIAALPEPV
jgi:MoxR-like ATPase